MAKVLVISDPHVTVGGKLICGVDPFERLCDALAHAATHHSDANHVILLGDLVSHGSSKEYARFARAFEGLPWPVTFMMGNHDLRANFLTEFPETETHSGFIQSAVDLGDVFVITLDSLEESPEIEHAGYLCETRLNWLRSALESAGDTPCLVFLHHPPMAVGMAEMDGIGLQDVDAFFEILTGSPAAHLFCGHNHRNVVAMSHGLPVTIFKSTCVQTPLKSADHQATQGVDTSGGYGVILTDGDEITVHFVDFACSL